MQTQKNWIPRDQTKMRNIPNSVYAFSAEEKLLVMEALDHLHVTRQYQEMGSCSVCKKISLKKCSGCNTFYCSSECQTFDWPKHRFNCPKQGDCLSDRGSFAVSRRMQGPSFKNFNEESLLINDRGSPFIALTNQLRRKSGNVIKESKSLANFKIGNKQYQKKESQTAMNDYKKNFSNDRKRNHSPKKLSFIKKSSPEEKETIVSGNNSKNNFKDFNKKLLKSIENVPNGNSATVNEGKNMEVTKLGRIEVIAMYRESPNRYWVMLMENLKKYEDIQEILNKECKNYERVQPKVGLICGCDFGDEWFRAEILSLTPDAMVHFIDYGNISTCDVNTFKKLPDHLTSSPGLAFQIEFEVGTPQQYKTEDLDSLKFTIEETSKTFDGIPRVKIVEGMFGPTEMPLKLAKPPEKKKSEVTSNGKQRAAMDTVSANTSGMLFFLPGDSIIRYASIVPDNIKDASESLEKVLNITSSSSTPIDAKPDDLVLVTDGEGNDQRGRVVLKLGSTYFVQLIDCGNVISSENVYALPEDLKNLMELGVKVSLLEIYFLDEVKRLETCFFTVTGEEEPGKWLCILKNGEKEILAEVLLEKPTVEKVKWKPEFTHLKSGSTVEISAIISPNSFYVRPVDVEMEQKFLDMNMEMIQFATKATDYTVPPQPGELCCAKYQDDGCFYRAVVHSVEKGKIRVLFVDFGNEQATDLKDIKPLPESLRNVPFLAVKIVLRKVSTEPWNNMIKDYIGRLMSENVELTLMYDHCLSNGVILREKVSGIVVNDFLENAKAKITNSGMAESRRKAEIFLDDDMEYTRMAVGSSCTLAILYVAETEFKKDYTFWATPAEVDNFNYVNVELSSLICEHCESQPTPYEPSYRELCLAEFEGSWYRAICAASVGEDFKVIFVDFGNCCDLKSESIRKMEKKFLKAPALAMNCTISGREKLRGNAELTDRLFLKLLERINTFISNVTVSKFDEDTFVLEIPEINEMLSR